MANRARDGIIPAGHAVAIPLEAGEVVEIVNTHGSQVLDTWAFDAADPGNVLSMEHTRSVLSKARAQVGDALYGRQRQKMLTLLADTSPGEHDTLLCACNLAVYRELGVTDYHRNCDDNLHEALAVAGYDYPRAVTPAPWNLFMNVRLDDEGRVIRGAPGAKAGDALRLRAEVGLLLVLSACPQDITIINGPDRAPRDCHWRIVTQGD